MRPFAVDRRTRAGVGIVVGAALAAAAVVWMLTPRFEVAGGGERHLIGGVSVPGTVLQADPTGHDGGPGRLSASVPVTSAGLFPVRVSNPRPVTVDEGAEVTVALAGPQTAAPTAVELARGDALDLWVTIAQYACSPGTTSRIERGVHGVAVDVTAWGMTRTEVVDVEMAAYAETPDGVLPPCA